MNKFFSFLLCVVLASTFALAPLTVSAAESASAQTNAGTPDNVNAAEELSKQQKQLDSIRQEVSTTTNDSRLGVLNANTQDLNNNAQTLLTNLLKQQSQLEAQLGVLGPIPEPGAEKETTEVTEKRTDLTTQKTVIDEQITQIRRIREQATNLSAQIVNLRRNSLKTQLALNSGTILRPGFWLPLFKPSDEDLYRLSVLEEQASAVFTAAWQPQWRIGTIFLLLLAAALSTVGYRLLNRAVAQAGMHYLPAGHLRRSFLATATVVVIVFTVGGTASLIAEAFTRVSDMSSLVKEVSGGLVKLAIFCAILAGLGKAFLSTDRPSWRLPSIADPVAQAMRPFPLIAAGLVFIFGSIEIVNNTISTSLSTTVVNNGLSSLFIALTACRITLRGNHIRRLLLAKGEKPEMRSTLAGIIHLAVFTTSLVILLCLLTGYIALAHFLTYELLWVGIVLSCLYLLINLVVDVSETLFLPTSSSGKRLKGTLNLDDRHLSQASSIFSAAGKITLILLAMTALLNGTFGTTTPMELVSNATEMWGGKGLEQLNLVPARVLNAMLCLFVGIYILHSSKGWLEEDFLPKTTMDIGIRASLVTLFTNIGYVLIILLTLATLGIQWNNLAWIVSALSVGIGFGLQEIVKNFISGLILLTERPVKVGDLVSISGVEGDIRRINVRATEIQLSDRSTVIVPNSQFISQNVRNVTMGNAQGVVTIELKFPLDIDPEQIRDILLNTYREHETILSTPSPSVTFKQLDTDGIVMSITGYVRSPRVVSGTKSDLLFEILKRLRANKEQQQSE